MADHLRDRFTAFFQKNVANPVMRRNPLQTLLETTGRKSGQPRRTWCPTTTPGVGSSRSHRSTASACARSAPIS